MTDQTPEQSSALHMIDVGNKQPTDRTALATGLVKVSSATMTALLTRAVPKGDVVAAAQLAGIQAAKRTPELLPLCHPLNEITGIEVKVLPNPASGQVEIEARVRAFGRTGVEMEALCAVATAALCVYDMCKALDPEMEISAIRLLEKTGGKKGHWQRSES